MEIFWALPCGLSSRLSLYKTFHAYMYTSKSHYSLLIFIDLMDGVFIQVYAGLVYRKS